MGGSEVIRRCHGGERGEGGALTQRIRLPREVEWLSYTRRRSDLAGLHAISRPTL
jgi:hypothetical protein